ncbi:hypothetical protein HDU93_002165 [Gonapodya sp. JEL0774]|nr:hypothetical protein HDU93_002165 [Gonapodya sp. JEL0774]
MDESPDTIFYGGPRFVTHIDDDAITALTKFYAKSFDQEFHARGGSKPNVLDVCSSWISHFPPKVGPSNAEKNGYGKVVGTGMVAQELARNKALDSYFVRDLNQTPSLSPLDDNTFDFVTCTVSIDYLTKPQQVLSEILRVLK